MLVVDGSTLQKRFMRKGYAQTWPSRRESYGFTEFERGVCAFVASRVPLKERMLDVGSGTGWPHASYFSSLGYAVTCLDIAESLLATCPNPVLGDAEVLPFQDNSFGCVYCFNSTWYFVNPLEAIAEMLRVSSNFVIFDANNAKNEAIAKSEEGVWISLVPYSERTRPDGTVERTIGENVRLHYETPVNASDVAQALSGFDYQTYAKEGEGLRLIKEIPDSVSRLVYAIQKHG